MSCKLSAIVAVCDDWGIGLDGGMVVENREDMRHFVACTTGHPVIMGRKTLESFPGGRPLKNRRNIVLTHNHDLSWPGVETRHNLDEVTAQSPDERIFIIGGASLYNETIGSADTLYITHIHHTFADADTFFPPIDETMWEKVDVQEMPADERHAYPYTFVTYRRKR